MAWSETLLDASFRGVAFQCVDTRDGAQRDVQRHPYPYRDGDDTEDLGRSSIGTTITAKFWGDDYEDRLQKFLVEMEKPGPGELIHPIFGSIPLAQLLDWSVGHDAENPDSCLVQLQFIQSKPSSPFFVRKLPEQKAAAARQLKDVAIDSAIDAFSKRLRSLSTLGGVMGRLNALRATANKVLGVVHSAVGAVRGAINTVLDIVNYPSAFAADIANSLRGLVDLRGFTKQSLMPDWKSLKNLFKDIVRLPVSASKGVTLLAFQGTTQAESEAPIAIVPEDLQALEALIKTLVAGELIEAATDVLIDQIHEPTLSPPDIEAITNDVREAVQDAITANRELYPVEVARPITEPLKDAALAVQEAAVAIIEKRPPLTRRTVPAAMNLHLVAFAWYGDYSRAAELFRLNPDLRNPNALAAGDVLNAYQR